MTRETKKKVTQRAKKATQGVSKKATQGSGKAVPRKEIADRRSVSRLERILMLVPFCIANPDVSVTQLAERFGASREDILRDLDLLFLCGLPEYSPADLIEVFVEEDRVSIKMADYFSRPLRITAAEAMPLYLKAKALLEISKDSGLVDFAPLSSALDKLAAILEPSTPASDLSSKITFHLEKGAFRWIGLLRGAIENSQAIHCEYWTYARDTISSRTVEPHLVFSSMGNWYFTGYCRLAQDRRIFRLDRIKGLTVADETFEPPAEAPSLPPAMVYVPQSTDTVVVLDASQRAGIWLKELVTTDSIEEGKGGRVKVTLRTSTFEWLEKLLLRLGPEVKVVSPKELALKVQIAAREALALYS